MDELSIALEEVMSRMTALGVLLAPIAMYCILEITRNAKRRGDRVVNDFEGHIRTLYSIAQSSSSDSCPYCGCTEMLCGHNGPGCEKEEN